MDNHGIGLRVSHVMPQPEDDEDLEEGEEDNGGEV